MDSQKKGIKVMTKSTKQLLGLAGALALLGGAYGTVVLINKHNEEKQAEQSKAEKEANTFYLSKIEQPVDISYTNSYGTFDFSYDAESESWTYMADEHFPVTQSYLTTLANDMKSLKAERKLEEIQDDLSVYGLDDPTFYIAAKGADDTRITVWIGSSNSYSSDYYAKVEGEEDIYTVSSGFVSDISNDISALQVKESFPTITSPSVTNMELANDNTSIEMQKEVTKEPASKEETTEESVKEYEEAADKITKESKRSEEAEETVEMIEVTRWIFSQGGKINRIEEDEDIHTLLANAVGLSFEDCADYYADEEEKKVYGLNENAEILYITYTVGEEEKNLRLTIGNTTEDEEYYYTSMNDSDQVNLVSKESIDEILEAFSNYSL